jgi:hypothetical protein
VCADHEIIINAFPPVSRAFTAKHDTTPPFQKHAPSCFAGKGAAECIGLCVCVCVCVCVVPGFDFVFPCVCVGAAALPLPSELARDGSLSARKRKPPPPTETHTIIMPPKHTHKYTRAHTQAKSVDRSAGAVSSSRRASSASSLITD